VKHFCPMCGEQWNDDKCEACGWFEGKQTRYTEPVKAERKHAWQFYMNGTFCTRCGVAIGDSRECKP
jgi:hypothetical protein